MTCSRVEVKERGEHSSWLGGRKAVTKQSDRPVYMTEKT
jgi:hypothetical protein